MGELGLDAGVFQTLHRALDELAVLVHDPGREIALGTDRLAGPALLLALGQIAAGLEAGMLFLRAGDGFVDLAEDDALVLADERAAVKGRAAQRRNDGCAGIRLGNDVGELQNALAEQRMLVRDDLADLLNDSHHFIDGVDALLGVGGVAADALGLDDDLCPAALAALDRGGRGLANDDEIGLCQPRDLAGGDALEAFLMDGAGDADLAGEVLAGLFRVAGGCRDHGAVAALHVGGAAAVDPAVDDLAAERVVLPLRRVDHVDGVDVAVHQDRLAGAFAVDGAEHAAVFVDDDLIKAVLFHLALHEFRDALLLAGIAGDPDGLLAKFDQLFVGVHAASILSSDIFMRVNQRCAMCDILHNASIEQPRFFVKIRPRPRLRILCFTKKSSLKFGEKHRAPKRFFASALYIFKIPFRPGRRPWPAAGFPSYP